MSQFLIGNIYLVTSVLTSALGHVMLKALISGLPKGISNIEAIRLVLLTDRIWRSGGAGILIVAGFVFWLLCLQRLPLSYAAPIACSSVLVMTFFCVFFLGETVGWRLWLGAFLIAMGSGLVVLQA